MSQPIVTLLVGLLTAAVTIGGWIVLHHFTLRRDEMARRRLERVKRLEITLDQTERQIAEFYGPLYGLIHQIWATWEVKERIRNEMDGTAFSQVDHYLGEKYFHPLHDRIRAILMDRLHLIESGTMPASYYEYVKHATMENIQIKLWAERQIETAATGIGWPKQFPIDVEAGLRVAMARRKQILEELRG